MKTAEEWIKYLDPNTSDKSCCYSPVPAEDIKQIQLDAVKEGMRRAAGIAGPTCGILDCGHETCAGRKLARQAILAASKQLTEKDL